MTDKSKSILVTDPYPEVSKYINDGKDLVLFLLLKNKIISPAETELWRTECKLSLVLVGDPEDDQLALESTLPKKYQGVPS